MTGTPHGTDLHDREKMRDVFGAVEGSSDRRVRRRGVDGDLVVLHR